VAIRAGGGAGECLAADRARGMACGGVKERDLPVDGDPGIEHDAVQQNFAGVEVGEGAGAVDHDDCVDARYLFVLLDESERMRRARLSRTFTRNRKFQWRAMSTVVGQLFVRASERAERIYDAMCARGWK